MICVQDFHVHEAGEGGWCEWVTPMHGHGSKNYQAMCSNCGVVHEVQFRVFVDRKGRNSVKLRARMLSVPAK